MQTHLMPGEEVLAGIYLQRPSTTDAALQGGIVTGASGLAPTVRHDDDDRIPEWIRAADAQGVDPDMARRTVWLALVVTSDRILLVRRSSFTGRLKELLAAWPLAEVERVEVPRNGARLTIRRDGSDLSFELPLAHRFLPDVYRELPTLVENAQGRAGITRSGRPDSGN